MNTQTKEKITLNCHSLTHNHGSFKEDSIYINTELMMKEYDTILKYIKSNHIIRLDISSNSVERHISILSCVKYTLIDFIILHGNLKTLKLSGENTGFDMNDVFRILKSCKNMKYLNLIRVELKNYESTIELNEELSIETFKTVKTWIKLEDYTTSTIKLLKKMKKLNSFTWVDDSFYLSENRYGNYNAFQHELGINYKPLSDILSTIKTTTKTLKTLKLVDCSILGEFGKEVGDFLATNDTITNLTIEEPSKVIDMDQYSVINYNRDDMDKREMITKEKEIVLKTLVNGITLNSSIRVLKIYVDVMGDKRQATFFLEQLSVIIDKCYNIEKLSIMGSPSYMNTLINPKSVRESLRNNKTIKTFIIRGGYSAGFLDIIMEDIFNMTNIKYINLTNITVDHTLFKMIGKCLGSVNNNLKRLKLVSIDIRDPNEGLYLRREYGFDEYMLIFEALKTNTKLKCLEIYDTHHRIIQYYNRLRNEIIKILIDHNHTLKWVSFKQNLNIAESEEVINGRENKKEDNIIEKYITDIPKMMKLFGISYDDRGRVDHSNGIFNKTPMVSYDNHGKVNDSNDMFDVMQYLNIDELKNYTDNREKNHTMNNLKTTEIAIPNNIKKRNKNGSLHEQNNHKRLKESVVEND